MSCGVDVESLWSCNVLSIFPQKCVGCIFWTLGGSSQGPMVKYGSVGNAQEFNFKIKPAWAENLPDLERSIC